MNKTNGNVRNEQLYGDLQTSCKNQSCRKEKAKAKLTKCELRGTSKLAYPQHFFDY